MTNQYCAGYVNGYQEIVDSKNAQCFVIKKIYMNST